MDLTGKSAIVTGSAAGVGAATVLSLAQKGCNVVVNYTKSESAANDVVAQCQAAGAKTLLVRADVSSDADCRRLVGEAADAWGGVDILVNNAGTSKFVAHKNLDGLDMDDFQRIYAVNVVGPYQMIRAVAPHMKRAGEGAIVNISSLAGVNGMGSSIAYATSKGALNTMTLSLARVLGPEIRVNTICPGMIQGRWLRQGLGEETYNKLLESQQNNLPLRRVSTPEDIADAVLWLISGGALVTGEIVLVDGGMHLGFAPLMAR